MKRYYIRGEKYKIILHVDINIIYNVAEEIVNDENFEVEIRLIGVTVSGIKEETSEQLRLF